LHHEPDSVAWAELIDNVDDLRKVAGGYLATRVRGGVVERGRGVEEVSREEHFVAWLIHYWEAEGVSSDEEIHELVKRTYPSLALLTPKEIGRIRRERLEPPP
jgi:hypothetical protein